MNDNPPAVVEKNVWLCNVEPVPVVLNVMDKDGKENGPPYYVQLTDDSDKHWSAEMNDTSKNVILVERYTTLQR